MSTKKDIETKEIALNKCECSNGVQALKLPQGQRPRLRQISVLSVRISPSEEKKFVLGILCVGYVEAFSHPAHNSSRQIYDFL